MTEFGYRNMKDLVTYPVSERDLDRLGFTVLERNKIRSDLMRPRYCFALLSIRELIDRVKYEEALLSVLEQHLLLLKRLIGDNTSSNFADTGISSPLTHFKINALDTEKAIISSDEETTDAFSGPLSGLSHQYFAAYLGTFYRCTYFEGDAMQQLYPSKGRNGNHSASKKPSDNSPIKRLSTRHDINDNIANSGVPQAKILTSGHVDDAATQSQSPISNSRGNTIINYYVHIFTFSMWCLRRGCKSVEIEILLLVWRFARKSCKTNCRGYCFCFKKYHWRWAQFR
jgi:hypothetical protein